MEVLRSVSTTPAPLLPSAVSSSAKDSVQTMPVTTTSPGRTRASRRRVAHPSFRLRSRTSTGSATRSPVAKRAGGCAPSPSASL
ncbi:hypothetical protein ACLESO_33375 [Pyxidicoccus sp. 3LG]